MNANLTSNNPLDNNHSHREWEKKLRIRLAALLEPYGPLLTTAEIVEAIGKGKILKPETARQWRAAFINNKSDVWHGFPFIRIGSRVAYFTEDVIDTIIHKTLYVDSKKGS